MTVCVAGPHSRSLTTLADLMLKSEALKYKEVAVKSCLNAMTRVIECAGKDDVSQV